MDFKLTEPCDSCPFLRKGPKPVRLTRDRIKEIAAMFDGTQDDGSFVCHKTHPSTAGKNAIPQHCAGALIFAEKHEAPTQMMRIGERVGFYDHEKLVGDEEVFDDLSEWLETAL